MSSKNHHENTQAIESNLRKDFKSLYTSFHNLDNPFKEKEKNLVQTATKVVLNSEASKSIKIAQQLGEKQYNEFVRHRIYDNKESFHNILPKNKLCLSKQNSPVIYSKTKQKIANLISDCKLHSRLFIACQAREGNLENFFTHENYSFPIAISEHGKLRKCASKSDFLKCLYEIEEQSVESPKVDMKVIDGAAFLCMNAPKCEKTIGDYCMELEEKAFKIANDVQRTDFVFDVYKDHSLKLATRETRENGMRIAVHPETPLPKDFQSILRNNQNKTELFQLLADTFIVNPSIVCTKLERVITKNKQNLNRNDNCNHEEAETRVILHVVDGSQTYKNILIIMVDTDAVIIALCHFFPLSFNKLWVEFGVGQNRKYPPIHKIAYSLGEETCRALSKWFMLTGCDTVSIFSGHGKKTAWKIWKVFSEVTETFVRYFFSCQYTLCMTLFSLSVSLFQF